MALSGYERVKRHRQKKAGLPVGLLSRGQKARAAAALMAAEGISRATAFRLRAADVPWRTDAAGSAS